MEWYPSDVKTSDTNYIHLSRRKYWVLPGVVANVGIDIRTRKKGKFYVGATYKRPFLDFYTTIIDYSKLPENVMFNLVGGFLTADIRYFFPVEKNADIIRDYD